jgi:filamentous hemagglutinin family protein
MIKKITAAFLIWLIGGWPTIVFALPQDGQVVGGAGTITEPTATSMQIDQTTNNMVINWNSFNIAANESVNFTQPSSSAVALNRVIGADPSILLGSLTANGNVFITNGSGVFFGHGSTVDVHGLVATTMHISDQDFLNENYNFTQDINNLSSVINEGNISAASYVGLLAPAVENRGEIITASLGSIDLASGTAATMDFTGDGLIQFEVTQAVAGTVLDKDGNELEDRVSNKGLLQADGGQIRMSAKDAGDVIRHVVNMEGTIRANSVVEKNGKVFLMGGDSGVVSVSGTIETKGDDAGEKGGEVVILGEKVGLFDQAKIDASGDAGGGEILLGGEQQGATAIEGQMNADFLYMDDDVEINADAVTNGDGGRIITWATDTNRAYADIYARGGALSGDGGFVEISGGEYFEIGQVPDVTAANGTAGHWLIDPVGNDLSIVAGGGNTNINAADPFATTSDSASVGWNLILAALIAGTSVTVTTTASGGPAQNGDINVMTDLDYNGIGTGKSLTLTAIGDITFSNKIFDSSGTDDILNLNLNSGGAIAFNASGNVISGNLVASTLNGVGGNFTIGSVADLSVTGTGSSSITAFDFVFDATLNFSGTGTFSLNNSSTSTGFGIGAATCSSSCDTLVDNAELNRITVTNGTLEFNGSSTIFVKDVAASNSDQINQVTLTQSTGQIEFETGSGSTFTNLTANAGNGIAVNDDVTTTGNMALNGDSNNSPDGTDNIAFAGSTVLTSGGSLTLDAANGGLTTAGMTTLNADNGITINDSFTSSGAGAVSINADFDNNGSGDFNLASGAAINFSAFDNALAITANDVDIQGTITMGTGQLAFTASFDGTMGIGAATCGGTCGMTISGTEFQAITTTDIQFITTGGAAMYIDSLTAANTATSTGLVQFNSAGDITVSGSTLTFNMAGNGFANGINIHAQSGTLNLNTGVTVTTGGLVLRGQTGVSIASGLTFTAGDAMFLQRAGGGSGDITAAGAATFNAGNGIEIDENLNASGALIFNAGSGNFVISAGETLTTNNNNLSITAADFDLSVTGAINAGTGGDVTITASSGGTINLGAATGSMQIDNTELGLITAANLILGDTTTTVINVNGITNTSITGTVTLNATAASGVVQFDTAASSFNTLAVNADNGIEMDVSLTTVVGAITLVADVSSNGGDVLFDSGTTVVLDSATTISADRVDITGTSTVAEFNSDTSIADLTLGSNGTLQADGMVSATTGFTWSGTSEITGGGSFITGSGVTGSTTSSVGTRTLNGITWTQQGNFTWDQGGGTNFTFAGTNAILDNSGTFIIATASTSQIATSGTGSVINNTGIFTHSGSNNTNIESGVEFNNKSGGQVNVTGSGGLDINSNGADAGTYAVSSGSTLIFDTGTRTFSSTTAFSGTGNVDFSSGTHTLTNSTYASTLGTTVSGATVNFDITGGTTIADLTVSGGILQGTGAVTVTNSFSWSGTSEIGGTGFTTESGVTGSTTSSVGTRTLNGITWTQKGNFTWDQGGGTDFTFAGTNAILDNSGTFIIATTSVSSDIVSSGSGSRIDNTGIFTHSGTVNTDIESGVEFNNKSGGQVNVTGSGGLDINSNGADAGTYAVSSGSTLTFDTGTRSFDGVSFTGLGTVDFNSGTFSMSNSLTFEDIDVTLTQAITGTGTLNLNASAGNSIGIGAVCGGCTTTFTTAKLAQLSATDLVIGGAGNAFIETVVIGDFATITGNISMLTTAGNITFNTDSMAFFNDAKLTSLSAAAGTITVPGIAAGDIGIGNATCSGSCAFSITGAKLQTITAMSLVVGDTTTGNLYIDGVTATDVANIANVTLNATNAGSMVAFMGSGSTFQGLTLNSDAGITLNLDLTTTGVTTIDADSDNDGTGDFTVNSGITLNTTNSNLLITANDINLSGTTALNAGTGDVTITISIVANNIAVGDDAVGTLKVDDQELSRIIANNLNIGDSSVSGNIFVDAVTLTGTNITSLNLINGSTGAVSFDGTRLSTTTANLSVTAGSGGISQSIHTIVGGGTSSFTSTGDITMNEASNDLGTNLTINAAQSFDVDPGATTTLTDLSITVNPAGSSTYALDITNLSNITTFNLADSSATNISSSGIMATAGLNLSLTASSGIFINSGTINVGTGSLSITSNLATNGNAILVSSSIIAGSVSLEATGADADIQVNNGITVTGGSVSIQAVDSVIFGLAGADILANGAGSVTIQSNSDSSDSAGSDSISMVSGVSIDAGSGTIALTSTGSGAGNISLGLLTTTSSSSTAISVNADNGVSGTTITDINAGSTNISAVNGGVVLVARSSIGGTSDATALEIDGATLDASNFSNSMFLNLESDISISNLSVTTQANFIGSGNITQTGAIVVGALTASLTSGSITLTNTSNNVSSVSFSATGDISYVDTDDFNVNTTNTVAGVTTSGGSIDLSTTGGITVDTDVTISSGTGTVALTADSDKDGTGDLTISGSVTVNSNGNAMTLQGATLDLTASLAAVNSGSALTTVNLTKNTTADSSSNLSKITASALTINVTGDLTVNGVTSADLANIGSGTGLLTLYASNDIIFSSTASDHNGAVTVEADNDITLNVDVTSSGDFKAEADHDKNGTGDFTLVTARTLSSTSGNIDITAVAITNNGIITAPSGTVTLTETGGTTDTEAEAEAVLVEQADEAGDDAFLVSFSAPSTDGC